MHMWCILTLGKDFIASARSIYLTVYFCFLSVDNYGAGEDYDVKMINGDFAYLWDWTLDIFAILEALDINR